MTPACSEKSQARLYSASLVLFLVSSVLVGGCRSTAPGLPTTELVHAEVLAFLDEWNRAVATQDQAAIRAAYADGHQLLWFEDGMLRYQSGDDILSAMQQFPRDTHIHTIFSNVTTRLLSARHVYCSATFQTSLTMPTSGFEYGGIITMLLERQEGGWVFIDGHTSTLRSDAAGR